jgi:hypothetical protein
MALFGIFFLQLYLFHLLLLQRLLKILSLNFSFRIPLTFIIFSIICCLLLGFIDALDFLISLLLFFHVFFLDFIENVINLISIVLLITLILILILIILGCSIVSCSRFTIVVIITIGFTMVRMVLSVMLLKLELRLGLS